MTNQQSLIRPGSALLLTVMIMAILTTTTLGAVAVRFDQLISTDKVGNAAVAKSAADSTLARLKEKLSTNQPITPTGYNYSTNNEFNVSDFSKFRPNPRHIVGTYERTTTSLPRCLAVAVISPWVNDGRYLFSDSQDGNQALLFYYANIINDSPLGVVPGNAGSGGLGKNAKRPISDLTNMGQFFNPFALPGSQQDHAGYWTIKLGGPDDEFLTKKGPDGASSYYRGLDFVYIPYLPRFSDSALFSGEPGTGIRRISGDELRSKFESTIKDNGFKVWLDASVNDSVLYQYGLGDLFVNDNEHRIQWLQPSLWNDLPEASLSGPYVSNNLEDNNKITWQRRELPLLALGSNDAGWRVEILRGAKSYAFARSTTSQSFSKNGVVTGLLYGSLEGLRLNQKISLKLLNKSRLPLGLKNRSVDQGMLYNVVISQIGPVTVHNGVEAINISFKLADDDYSTPKLINDDVYPTWAMLDSAIIVAEPQFSTAKSLSNVTINATAGTNATVSFSSTCAPNADFTACPAVGDIVNLVKDGQAPVWGVVKTVSFSGATMTGILLDKLRRAPKPVRHFASAILPDNKIAYFGGEVVMNDYDGGYNGELNELWLYDALGDTWQYIGAPPPAIPAVGRRAGAVMVYDSLNNQLVIFGGYYHEPVAPNDININCELSQSVCLYTNVAGFRIAKRITNDVLAYNLGGTGAWSQLSYGSPDKIENNKIYTVRLAATLSERSGLNGWRAVGRSPANTQTTLNLSPGSISTVTIKPSVAGFAKGDDVFISGSIQGEGSVNAWGRIDSLDYPNNQLRLAVYGYTDLTGGGTVILSSFQLYVQDRKITAQRCTGTVFGQTYSCRFAGGSNADMTGYAVGDLVVLEEYLGSGSLTKTLSGYISFIDTANNRIYFVADERSLSKDFSDPTQGIINNESALAVPLPRYGAAWAIDPNDTGSPPGSKRKAHLWQGAAASTVHQTRFDDIWTAEFASNNVITWTQASHGNDAPSASESYNLQVLRDFTFRQVYSTNSDNGAIIKDKEVCRGEPPICRLEWNNDKEWNLNLTGSDAGSFITVGAFIRIERQRFNGDREAFHGTVTAVNSASSFKFKHHPDYPGDSGLIGDANNTKISVYAWYATWNIIGSVSWNTSGYFRISANNNPNLLPPAGAPIMIWRSNDPAEAYTMTIARREFINSGYHLYPSASPNQRPARSPLPDTFTTAALAIHSAGSEQHTKLITIGDLRFRGNDPEFGGPEWVILVNATQRMWGTRQSGQGTLNIRPSPRRGGSLASLSESSNTKFFLVGGTQGRYSNLWRQNSAGHTNKAIIQWEQYFSHEQDNGDLPNLFGGALTAFRYDNKVYGVYFGGKLKFDPVSADYGRQFGPKLMTRPDDADDSFDSSDNSFYIAGQSSGVDAASFVNAIKDNVSTDFAEQFTRSVSFRAGAASLNKVCAYLGQNNNCNSDQLLLHLGTLGRHGNGVGVYGHQTWGRSLAVLNPGSNFLRQGTSPSLILSGPTLSGQSVNKRWDQEGYHPYICDIMLNLNCRNVSYGKLAASFTSSKTVMLAGYTKLTNSTKGGAILVTASGVGAAVTNPRGGSNDTVGSWYSYCAASEIEKDQNGEYVVVEDSRRYKCRDNARRFLAHLPDAEDLLFTLNAGLVLSSIDTYKIVGYHGGVKRGYLVTTRSGEAPFVEEIVP